MSEKNNRKVQYVAGICASLAFVFTGAALSWPSPAIPKFNSGEANVQITDTQCSWVVSLHSAGALLGCYFGQVLNERVGRKRTILGSSVPGLLGSLPRAWSSITLQDLQLLAVAAVFGLSLPVYHQSMIIFTKLPEVMYVARFLMGLATGIAAVVTMIYITEIADKEIRGALGMVVQVMNNFGALLIYSIGPFVSYTVLNSILVSIPILYVLACLWIPESPYYHLKDGRIEAAKKEFMVLRSTKNVKWVDEQIGLMHVNVKESMENKGTVKELFFNNKYRKSVYIVTVLKMLQYMTGILVIQSYLEVIFRQSSSISGPYASIVYGFVQLAAGVGATFLSRWFGRRILMTISCLGVSISMTLVGLYFYLQDSVRLDPNILASLSSLPLVGIFGFNILYAVGIGNLPYVMQVELFPINVKAAASSAATMLACILGFVVTKCYQNVKDFFGHCTVFWLFAGIGYAGVFYIYFYVPETKGKTLEEVVDNMEERPETKALRTEKVEENGD